MNLFSCVGKLYRDPKPGDRRTNKRSLWKEAMIGTAIFVMCINLG